jgi:hypothetical protein
MLLISVGSYRHNGGLLQHGVETVDETRTLTGQTD